MAFTQGQKVALAFLVFCACAMIIVGSLYAGGVIGKSPAPAPSSSKTPPPSSKTPSSTPSSRTPSTPGAYSGPSYAPAPSPAPAPDACTPDGQRSTNFGLDCCSQFGTDTNQLCNPACTPDGQPVPDGNGSCCGQPLNDMCVSCIPDGNPARIDPMCCSKFKDTNTGNCAPRPTPCVLGAEISRDNVCATSPCGLGYYETITYQVVTPAQNGGTCENPKRVLCPNKPCPMVAAPGQSVSAGLGGRAGGSACFHDQDCASYSCTQHRCDDGLRQSGSPCDQDSQCDSGSCMGRAGCA
jgi:hypothetical protein